jgi:hypothetical protein
MVREEGRVMSERIALQLNAVVGVGASALASATIWLVLSRPMDVAQAVAAHQYGAIATAVARQLGSWLQMLLWYL